MVRGGGKCPVKDIQQQKMEAVERERAADRRALYLKPAHQASSSSAGRALVEPASSYKLGISLRVLCSGLVYWPRGVK